MARTEYSVTIHTVRLFLHGYWALRRRVEVSLSPHHREICLAC
jgi:hypothetical protein